MAGRGSGHSGWPLLSRSTVSRSRSNAVGGAFAGAGGGVGARKFRRRSSRSDSSSSEVGGGGEATVPVRGEATVAC